MENSKKVTLTLLDKLIFWSLLKKEGSFEEMIIIKDIKKKVNISQDEVKAYSIQSTDKAISFNEEGAKATFDIEFTTLEVNIIKEGLKKLQEDKKLTEEHIELYKIFIN